MKWQELGGTPGLDRPGRKDGVKGIEPRPLSSREAGWIKDILRGVRDWRDADLSGARVVAEGVDAGRYRVVLSGLNLVNLNWNLSHDVLGQLWIETEDRLTVNVQLAQRDGQLAELSILALDSRARNVGVALEWVEVSRVAVSD